MKDPNGIPRVAVCCDLFDSESQEFDAIVAQACEQAARGQISMSMLDATLRAIAEIRVLARASAVVN
jgi:hypothetical protein